jgi:predicted HicB family RNase H-like nuclease
LHKRLAKLAERERVGLNQLATAMLTEAVASRIWAM